jgi:hypothetical protein
MPKGKFSHRWDGGLYINKRVFIYMPNHHRASSNGYVLRAIYVAEKALGKPLPINAVVHHHDRDQTNDDNSNIVICDSQAYHFLLHKRTRAYLACRNANWIKCKICKKYDDPKNLCSSGVKIYHKICINKYNRNNYKKTKNNESAT